MKRKIAISLSLSLLVLSPFLLILVGERFLDSQNSLPPLTSKYDAGLAAVPKQSVSADAPLPDRLIVRFQPQIAATLYMVLATAPNANPKLDASMIGNRLVQPVLAARVPALAPILAQYQVRAADAIDPPGGAYLLRTEGHADLAALREALAASHTTLYTEFDYPVRAFKEPNDPIYRSGRQWGLTQIEAPAAWDIMTGTNKTVIAIEDSGVGSHPELSQRLLNGFNFASDPASLDTNDDYGHGTYVAGIAAAQGDNHEGMAGVDWNATVLPVKVLNSDGVGSNATIAMGIRYAADQGADVINLSLGGTNRSQVVQEAVMYAAYPLNVRVSRSEAANNRAEARHGAVLIAAAGNKNQNGDPSAPIKPNYPAAYDQVIAVGATDNQDTPTAFSTYGPELSLCAPGYDIVSLDWNTKTDSPAYSTGSGTSSAAPFVAGTVGLMLSVNPTLSGSQVRDILEGTADYKSGPPLVSVTARPTNTPVINPDNGDKALSVPTPGLRSSFDGRVYDQRVGWGRLNTYKAVLAVVNDQSFPNRRARVYGTVQGLAAKGQPGLDAGNVVISLTPGDQRFPAADGFFSFANLPPGTYTLQATAAKYGLAPDPITFQIAGAENEAHQYNFNFSQTSQLLFKNRPVGAFKPTSEDFDRVGDDDYAYFSNTQHSLAGSFKLFWDNNGSWPVFGLPISEEFAENGRTVQYFERAVFEYHTELAGTKYEVQLALLGNQLTANRAQEAAFKTLAPFPNSIDHRYFYETNHSLSNANGFLLYWQTNNGKVVFGLPISEAFPEKATNGQTYIAQYFERAKMEWHPGSGVVPAHIGLGLLGLASAQAQGVMGK